MRIEDYALIGDLQTSALAAVASESRIMEAMAALTTRCMAEVVRVDQAVFDAVADAQEPSPDGSLWACPGR